MAQPSRRPRNRSPRYPSNPALALIANPRFRVIVSSTCNASSSSLCAPYVCASASACGATCNTDAQCIGSAYCRASDSSCQPDQSNGKACTADSQCTSGHCADGVCCDQACGGLCQACTAALKGAGNDGVCGSVAAASDPKNQCPDDGATSCQRNGMCNGAGACSLYANNTACGETTCSAGTQKGYTCDGLGTCKASSSSECSPYVCGAKACATSCADDAGCVVGSYCRAADATCQPDQAPGAACSSSSQCASGNCVDGVCCDAPCSGACQACAASKTGGTDGVCAAVKSATDPDEECPDEGANSCKRDGLCDGIGACRLYASGTACGTTTCASGTQTGYACNGTGSCLSAQTSSCSPYTCNGGSCGVSCADDSNCVASAFCDGTSHCTTDQDNGAACTGASQCKSGFCVDGVCCAQACGGACMACSAAKTGGADGTCAAVTKGIDPDNDCAADTPNTCKQDGECNGAGACELYQLGVQCGAGVCTGATLTGQQCDGFGVCASGLTSSCPNLYTCQGNACGNSCADDAGCVATAYCAGGTCAPRGAAGAACSAANQCATGFCVEGVCCDTACNGTCQACTAATKASGDGDGTCGAAKVGLDPHDDCPDDGVASCQRDGACDGAGACRVYASGVECLAADCAGNVPTTHACNGTGTCVAKGAVDCKPNVCTEGACATACATDDECASGAWCDGGFCKTKGKNGDACAVKEACASNLCVDGYCCNSACQGQCSACDAPGTEGTCTPIVGRPHGARAACAAGTAENVCATAQCDGTNGTSCTGYVGSDQTCRAASCADGVETQPEHCDGKGSCPPVRQAKCEPYVCAGETCGKAPCASDKDCSAKFRCDPSKHDCIPRDTTTCSTTDEHTQNNPDGTTTDCAPYRCIGNACKTDCNSIDDCASPNVCDGTSKCVAPTSDVAADEEGGCGCRVAGERRGERGGRGAVVLAALVALAWMRRRWAVRSTLNRAR
ncbi:MAG: hypothetical protein OZ921_01585 [Sorangiineae bacterium]|nr:hypothetical protein [Polyangiaceae bacterium]MEB2321174.1 hypothetical protein [Sorangiineae bacterium]